MPYLVRVARILGVLAIVGGVTSLYYRILTVNNVTVSLSFLLVVLVIATSWELTEALVASVASALCFNFFFIPPVRSFTVADPQNWLALCVFVVTAVTVSHLSTSAKRRALESTERQREMERLYTLSRNLLLLDAHGALAQDITNLIAQVFQLPGLVFYDRSSDRIHRAGPQDIPVEVGKLRDSTLQGTVFYDSKTTTTVIPISLGACL